MTTPRLVGHGRVTAIIVCLTNLHIGAGRESFEIGGVDNPIIRHPITREPYIPGSSLKGKMRSLLEIAGEGGANVEDGTPCGCGVCVVCRLFGRNVTKQGAQGQPTRLLFRDAFLTTAYKEKHGSLPESLLKYEVAINRKTGTVLQRGGGLRSPEYVPAGAEFDFEISVRIFEGDDPQEFKRTIEKAVQLLENDYLGGSGSRGYGKVKFQNLNFEGF